MKMILVMPPGPYLGQPAPTPTRFSAHCLLDRWVNEDAGDGAVLSRRSDDFRVRGGPDLRINIASILRDHVLRQIELALLFGQLVIRRWSEPHVDVKPDLMAGMPR